MPSDPPHTGAHPTPLPPCVLLTKGRDECQPPLACSCTGTQDSTLHTGACPSRLKPFWMWSQARHRLALRGWCVQPAVPCMLPAPPFFATWGAGTLHRHSSDFQLPCMSPPQPGAAPAGRARHTGRWAATTRPLLACICPLARARCETHLVHTARQNTHTTCWTQPHQLQNPRGSHFSAAPPLVTQCCAH